VTEFELQFKALIWLLAGDSRQVCRGQHHHLRLLSTRGLIKKTAGLLDPLLSRCFSYICAARCLFPGDARGWL
jgi:hypothetical protein